MKRASISLGDALRATHALHPADAQTREAMRRMLGWRDKEIMTPANPSLGAALPSSTGGTGKSPADARETPRWRHPPEQPGGAGASVVAGKGSPVAFTLTKMEAKGAAPEAPAVGEGGKILAAETMAEAPPPRPLFSRAQRRGILSAALATYVREGDLDMDAAIQSLAALRPLTRLPRNPCPTLRRGVQLLVDRGAGMDPFLADQDGLIRHLDDIMSDDHLEVLYFAGCPTRNVEERPSGRRRPWRPPPSGVPVLVLSDLGIGGPMFAEDRASVRDWLHFAQGARRAGHMPIGLVPYEARRWPPLLARAMVLLHWSERTTAREVSRAARDGLVRR